MAAHPTVTVYSLVVVYVLLALTLWIITVTDTQNLGRRSKIESSRTKFHGQLMAALQTELEISIYNFQKQLSAEAAHARGSEGMSPQGSFKF